MSSLKPGTMGYNINNITGVIYLVSPIWGYSYEYERRLYGPMCTSSRPQFLGDV